MGDKLAGGVGSFSRTTREVFSGTKIHLFKFGVEYWNFGAKYLNFGHQYMKIVSFRRVGR